MCHWPLWETFLPMLEGVMTWPCFFSGRANKFHDLEDGTDFRITRECWITNCHFSNDATCRPNVNCWAIFLCSQKKLWGSIPKRDHVVSVRLDRQGKNSGQAEVAYFQTIFTNEDVLRL